MSIRRDLTATALTALAALVFAAAHEGWDVPLVGDSRRWAAAAILLLGGATCAQGSPDARGPLTTLLAALGVAAAALGVVTLATGSLTALSLLAADVVVLWAASTARHVAHAPRRPVAS